MDTPSDNRLGAFFDEELDALSHVKGSRERVAWLIEHLDEYVTRWTGFVAATGDPGPEVPGFSMIEQAATRLAQEVEHQRYHRLLMQASKRLSASIARVRTNGTRENADLLEAAASELVKLAQRTQDGGLSMPEG